jgi:hypothetical protein
MGNSQSSHIEATQEVAQQCKFSKATFNEMIGVINDTHSVMQFYASALLVVRTPTRFAEYKKFSSTSEAIFNSTRNNGVSGLSSLDSSFSSYYDVYLYVRDFKTKYEQTKEDDDRRVLLTDAFNITYGTMKLLLNDLVNACQ